VSQADVDRLQYYSRRVKSFVVEDTRPDLDNAPCVHPSTYIRIAQLLQSNPLFPSLRRLTFDMSEMLITYNIFLFLSPRLESLELTSVNEEHTIVAILANLSSQMLRRIVIHDGKMSADFLKSFAHFKQLRSLELSNFSNDFTAWEVLGTLPSLANLTLNAADRTQAYSNRHHTHAAENSNSQTQSHSGGPNYFDALERLSVTGPFLFIQHLLGLIDSPCLTEIKFYLFSTLNYTEHEFDGDFTPSMVIITSKWSQSLKNLVLDSSRRTAYMQCYTISNCLLLLMGLHKMQTFHLTWNMKNMDDEVRRLVMSWPKLTSLHLSRSRAATFISLSTLRKIAENCPELRSLQIPLQYDTATFDASSKSLYHNLEVLDVLIVSSKGAQPSTSTAMEYQNQVARYLDFIFPYLTSISIKVAPDDVTWLGI
jgi:hypothetical protein